MTDRKKALEALLEKVEAGDDAGFRSANRLVFSTPCQDMGLQMREENCRHAYKGSLDAAKALHEAVLPGWGWGKYFTGGFYVSEHGPAVDDFSAKDDIPSRAWLIAILRALIEQEESE